MIGRWIKLRTWTARNLAMVCNSLYMGNESDYKPVANHHFKNIPVEPEGLETSPDLVVAHFLWAVEKNGGDVWEMSKILRQNSVFKSLNTGYPICIAASTICKDERYREVAGVGRRSSGIPDYESVEWRQMLWPARFVCADIDMEYEPRYKGDQHVIRNQ